ncbi:sugar ABC transporter ATP-binding protein [Desmospora profundinema]|uniref:Ribose transport system ATP-binding protein n=1 Tax=Desmospora profundinema TaxID=1571184 RepID=A0ABU1IKX3_9BACL|nr:sugar ABC transporter ATP-binding protein [Desmospora profundinema]MDR6225424.1 ribose transport system ATP-binding protein [Desmospora profundinema]
MEPYLEMKGVQKSFAGVKVLKGVDFSLLSGEVHALVGQNGAGKSTLMKVLGGIYPKDGGRIRVRGKERAIVSPRVAASLGIGIIHQELNLVPQLTVAENLFLGREHIIDGWPVIRWRRMREEASSLLERIGVNINPARRVEELSVGQQQLVEIAKVLSMKAEILVLDEPTAALTHRETKTLFETIRSLKSQGTGIVYISHRMEEIFRISDRITVLRDGEIVSTRKTVETDMDELVRMMVGRKIKECFPQKRPRLFGEERIRVENLSRRGMVEGIHFSIRAGEILGLFGLMGAGRTETADLLFGVRRKDSGRIWIDHEPVRIRQPRDAIQAGLTYVTENRKGNGLLLSMTVKENLSLPHLTSLSFTGVIHRHREEALARNLVRRLSIRTNGTKQQVGFLSGGNQQKVVIGKWLARRPKVCILDEPTRGVDISAKKEIYQLMNRLTGEGMAILLISSDLPELLSMSDRVLVLHEGRPADFFSKEEATRENVMTAATGGGRKVANSH